MPQKRLNRVYLLLKQLEIDFGETFFFDRFQCLTLYPLCSVMRKIKKGEKRFSEMIKCNRNSTANAKLTKSYSCCVCERRWHEGMFEY